LLKEPVGKRIFGVQATDKETGRQYEIQAKTVINATGVFTDSILQMDEPGSEPIIAPSQGVHIVLDKVFLPGEAAILVPHTDDGRVLFAVPWHDKIIIGTTDTPVKEIPAEPRALPEEIDFYPAADRPLPDDDTGAKRHTQRICRAAAPGEGQQPKKQRNCPGTI